MADYTVTAILTAKDNGFSAAFKNANSATETLGSKIKSGLGFGALMGIGGKAVSVIGTGLKTLVSDLNSTTNSWNSFTNNMKMSGMGNKQIESTKKDLQNFAKQTIYTSKDMASTYAQLYAVDNKTTTKLVKGFGMLAAAAENPTQAMKTLSTQATQTAAKSTLAWQDFKLIQEQTPAGMAQVAKAMGMSAKELTAAVQDGKVKTEDFFAAIEKCADNKQLQNLAMNYHTIGEAAEGLSATLSTGLAPAWEVVNDIGIDAITKLMGVVSKGIGGLSDIFKGVGKHVKTATSALEELGGTLSENEDVMLAFKGVAKVTANALKLACTVIEKLSKAMNKLLEVAPHLPMLATGILGISTATKKITGGGILKNLLGDVEPVKKVATKVKGISETIKSYIPTTKKSAKAVGDAVGEGLETASTAAGEATKAVGETLSSGAKSVESAGETIGKTTQAMGEKATEGAKGLETVAGTSTTASTTMQASGNKFLQAAVGFMAIATAITIAAAGFWILSQAAVTLSEGGNTSIAVFAGMVVAIGLLAGIFATLGTELDVAIPAMLSFGATVLMIGAGVALVGVGVYAICSGLAKLAGVLPTISESGTGAAKGLVALAGGILAIGVAVGVVGVVLVALGTFAGVAVTGIGVLALAGAAVVIVMAGFALACKLVKTQVQGIATSATTAAKQLKNMVSSISIVKEGLNALKSLASGAISALKNAFSGSVGALKSSATNMGNAVSNGIQNGLNKAVDYSNKAVAKIKSAMEKGVSQAHTIGVNIGKGLANGIRDEIPSIKAAAKEASSAATVKMKKTTKEHSPSRITKQIGAYLSQGLIIGMESEKRNISRVSGKLAELATYSPSRLSYAGDYSLNDNWDYSSTANYEITVVSELDGKVVSRQLAPTMQQEQNRWNARNNRKKGIR